MTNSIPLIPYMTVPCFQQAGPLQIWVNTGASSAPELLGWTRNGIDIDQDARMQELKSDLSGGDAGVPGDYQWLGEMHEISAELAQWSDSVLAKLERRVNPTVLTRYPGMLVGCLGGQFRALFLALNFVRCYTNVHIVRPIRRAPIGTPATFPRIVFTGLGDINNTDSKPWNSTYTATSSAVTAMGG